MSTTEWPLWEVFIRSKQGLNHKHVGSLRAPDATHIHATDIDEAEAFFEPSDTKIYRHPTFYEVPDGVKHM